MRQQWVIIAVLAGVGGFLIGAHWGASEKPSSVAEVPIRALLTEQAVAWNKGDLDGFLSGYWDSDELTFFSGNTVSKGFNAVRDRYRKRYQAEGKEMGHLTFSAIEMHDLTDKWAIAKGRWRVVMSDKAPFGSFVLILRRFPEGWKIVQDHTKEDGD